MIGGMHTIFYSKNADAVRAFFRDVLELPAVDAAHGWLLFAAPPAEVAVHPAEKSDHIEVYLMYASLDETVAKLKKRGIEFPETPIEQGWGRLTHLKLPDGQTLGLYEPHHPMAIQLGTAQLSAGQRTTKRAKLKPAKTLRKRRKNSR